MSRTSLKIDYHSAEFAPLTKRLSKDMKVAATNLSSKEARFLVDSYYMMQEQRIRMNNRVKRMVKDGEPSSVIEFLFSQGQTLEDYVKVSLDVYSDNHPVGNWLRLHDGIGPVLAAGLLAYYPPEALGLYAGNLWSFAGLNPGAEWKKGELRPWNARLKALCWKIGESFVKVSGRNEPNYGHVYKSRKVYETGLNERKAFAAQAADLLVRFNYSKSTQAYKALSQGKLAPGHIHARAKRYAVKLFLSHYHEAMFTWYFKMQPPPVYMLEHGGHYGYIPTAIRLPWANEIGAFRQDVWNDHVRRVQAMKLDAARQIEEEHASEVLDDLDPTEGED